MSQGMGVGQEKEVGVCGVESDVAMGTTFHREGGGGGGGGPGISSPQN